MAKGIIVLDEIPVICAECSFAHLTQDKQYFHCDPKNKTVYNAKPDWCPIKEMPSRKQVPGCFFMMDEVYGKEIGFNDCLDEIEGR